MNKLVIDCSTGTVTTEPLSSSEQTDYDARQADATPLWSALRVRRDMLLSASDFTQFADAPSWVDKATWATYRQQLRDLPANTTDPASPTWPAPPQTIPA